ncbi:hypothetical protein CVT24_005448 [Panaeolus cyanescens]|uniref:Uncharacterized protein n=1 Tax=Panaeolus cyanescens TaxID=181874 RepID=A0A409YC57_9AGAR|nr:hypothetical protein CVT24_005448 [Panaeolus cyanescens]
MLDPVEIFPLEVTDLILDELVAQSHTGRVLATAHADNPPFPRAREPETIKFRVVSPAWRAAIDAHIPTWGTCDAISRPEKLRSTMKTIQQAQANGKASTVHTLYIDTRKHLASDVDHILRACQGSLMHLYMRSDTLSELSSDLVLPKLETLYAATSVPVKLHWDSFPTLENLFMTLCPVIIRHFWVSHPVTSPIVMPPPLVEVSLRDVSSRNILAILSACPSIERLLVHCVRELDSVHAALAFARQNFIICPSLLFFHTDNAQLFAYFIAPRLRILHLDSLLEPEHTVFSYFLSRSSNLGTLATSSIPPRIVPSLNELRLVGTLNRIDRILQRMQGIQGKTIKTSFSGLEKISLVVTHPDGAFRHIWESLVWLFVRCGYQKPIYIHVPGYRVQRYRLAEDGQIDILRDHGLPDVYLNGKPVRNMPGEPCLVIDMAMRLESEQVQDYVL